MGYSLSTPMEKMIEQAVASLRGRIGAHRRPRTLLVLGSGLADLVSSIEDPVEVDYGDVPFMPLSTAPGHEGRFVAGALDGVDILCMQGRLHGYEGYSPEEAVFPIRVARWLGIETAILTNASGAIDASLTPGQVVLISDHINLTGANPLVGTNDDDLGDRFPDMGDAYSKSLRTLSKDAARSIGYDLLEGVYMGVSGPSFETPAEIRAFRVLGADLVGMSTVWETIAAVHCGLRVIGLSMVVNMASGISGRPITEADLTRAAQRGSNDMDALIRAIVSRLADGDASGTR